MNVESVSNMYTVCNQESVFSHHPRFSNSHYQPETFKSEEAGLSFTQRLENVLNVFLACLLLIPASFILLPVYLIYLVTEHKNGHFLFKGSRMGKDKKLFKMYKIRTLVNDAEKRTGVWHKGDKSLELWYGRFLRNTRIDELPQLFNIVKGDMVFVGPRPMRITDYENSYAHINGSEMRFSVKPGLTGYSQFYTPGSTPRKIRIHIDNYFIRVNKSVFHKLGFIVRTGTQFIFKLVIESAFMLKDKIYRLIHANAVECRRQLPRKKLGIECGIHKGKVNGSPIRSNIIDMNTEVVRLSLPASQMLKENEQVAITMVCKTIKKKRERIHKIHLNGTVNSQRKQQEKTEKNEFVVAYQPMTDSDLYWTHKYLLKASYGK